MQIQSNTLLTLIDFKREFELQISYLKLTPF